MGSDTESYRLSFSAFGKHEINRSIADRFERQVAQFPGRIAVKTATQTLTYARLNQLANLIAHALLARCEKRGEPIALLLEQHASLTAALLGVLKAGKIYVPLDPALPAARLAYLLEDSQASLIITNARNLPVVRALPSTPAFLDLDTLDTNLVTTNPGLPISPDTLCYLLYTSGSTGQPKGVPQSHRNVLADIRRQTNDLRITGDDHFALLFSCSSGASVAPIFGALLNGAALFPFDPQREGLARLGQWLREQEITICDIGVTAFRQLASTVAGTSQFPRLRLLSLGGEVVSPKDVALYQAHFSPDCVLQNALGTTETRTIAQYFIDKQTRINGVLVPVGYAVEDKQILLMGDGGEEVSPGQTGQIAVKSRYLSPGYWRKPELTHAAFLPDPQGGGERIYLTGDLGRMQADGSLLHLGRKDSQVKVRGYRVEITEIEMALLSLDVVKEAVVLAEEEEAGGRRLVAYLVPTNSPPPTVGTLRVGLAKYLPGYMLPATFVILEALPLTPNGKVDRRALPLPSHTRPMLDTAFVAPRDPIECTLARLWEEVLQVEQVGVYDDFLELGGHSLLATRVLSRIRTIFHTEVPLRRFFQLRTIAELALEVLRNQAAQLDQETLGRLLAEIEQLPDEES
jgi:amino acid adenylation domain-containing protein